MSRQRLHNDQHGALESKGNAAHQKRQTPQTLNQFLQLQQTRGNQVVQRLLAEGRFSSNNHPVQAKLTVGAPGSVHEQEADHVAQQIMNMPDKAVQREETLEDEQLVQTQLVQREEQLEDEEVVQAKFVQREEQLDDEEVVQAKFVQREEQLDDEDMVQAKFVQREETLDDETLQAKSNVQVPEVTSDVETLIEQKRGGGRPLPDSAREFFEPRFGQDFSGVKVHTDAQADSLNRNLQARAFATGGDIFFRRGEYEPDSSGGRELLAHELTHVVQQGGTTRISRKSYVEKDERAQETKETDEKKAVYWKGEFTKNGEDGQLTKKRESPKLEAYVPGDGKLKKSGITIGYGIEVRQIQDVDDFAKKIFGREISLHQDFIDWLKKAKSANKKGKEAYEWLMANPAPQQQLTREQAENTYPYLKRAKTNMAKDRLTKENVPFKVENPEFRLLPKDFDNLHPFVKEFLMDIAWNSGQFAYGKEDVIAEKLHVPDKEITPEEGAILQLRGLRGFVESLPEKSSDGGHVQGKDGRQKRMGWIDAKIAEIEKEMAQKRAKATGSTAEVRELNESKKQTVARSTVTSSSASSGEYQPDDSGGRELPHIVLQNANVDRKPAVPPTKTVEQDVFFISVAGIRHENTPKQMAITLLWQAVSHLEERYKRELQSHEAWLKAQNILSLDKYPDLKIWYGAKLSIIDAKQALHEGRIKDAHDQLQKAEQKIQVTAEQYKNPIVNEESIALAEGAVSVLEFVKDIAFATLEKTLEKLLTPSLTIAAPFASQAIVSIIKGLADWTGDAISNVDNTKFEDWIADYVQSHFTLDLSTVGTAIEGHKGEIVSYLTELTTTVIISANRDIAKREKIKKIDSMEKLQIWLNQFQKEAVIALLSEIAVEMAKKGTKAAAGIGG